MTVIALLFALIAAAAVSGGFYFASVALGHGAGAGAPAVSRSGRSRTAAGRFTGRRAPDAGLKAATARTGRRSLTPPSPAPI